MMVWIVLPQCVDEHNAHKIDKRLIGLIELRYHRAKSITPSDGRAGTVQYNTHHDGLRDVLCRVSHWIPFPSVPTFLIPIGKFVLCKGCTDTRARACSHLIALSVGKLFPFLFSCLVPIWSILRCDMLIRIFLPTFCGTWAVQSGRISEESTQQ